MSGWVHVGNSDKVTWEAKPAPWWLTVLRKLRLARV